ncbi:AraC family transcriptional regulator [Flagellimonas nanhaiensis]|uniref:AraC family transcriptional regulator n=1 Tax=Flagellimonas nanhaiensis TaxID=2292706 RepID=A0A371JPH7_9FLAO|nr:AraC family transcriptional regulator [Allomuricauda nanhaiensis]
MVIAIVGINNWFWDRGTSPTIISILDLFLWQFLYPVTLVHFFQKTSNEASGKIVNLKYLYVPFILLSACNIVISVSTIFSLYNLPQIVGNYIGHFYKTVSFLSVIFPIYTIILSYRFVLTHKDNPSKKWLKHLWVYLSIILLFGVGLELYRFIFSEKLPLTYLWTFSSIFIYWLVYKGMYQFKLSNDRYEIRTITKKEQSKSLSSNAKNSHFKNLLLLIEEEKIHHDPYLSREDVAQRLEISNGYLSQIIKENTSRSFSDLVNHHRIRDVKMMLKDPMFDNYSLLSIGLECGFNSKTSFYTNFKRETGLTPKEYKNK